MMTSEPKYFATGDADQFDHTFAVLVMSHGSVLDVGYFGVNVLFRRDGSVDATTCDSRSEAEWSQNRDAVVEVAREHFASRIDLFLKGGDPGAFTTLPRRSK